MLRHSVKNLINILDTTLLLYKYGSEESCFISCAKISKFVLKNFMNCHNIIDYSLINEMNILCICINSTNKNVSCRNIIGYSLINEMDISCIHINIANKNVTCVI